MQREIDVLPLSKFKLIICFVFVNFVKRREDVKLINYSCGCAFSA